MKFDVDGDLSILPLGINSSASTRIVLPKTLYVSGMFKAKPNLDLLASLRLTDWISFNELQIEFANGLPDSVTKEN